MQTSNYTIACVERGARFIADQVQAGDTPSLEEIAAAANLSKHHFHRLYRLATGETCAQTMHRLRLARGARALDGTSGSVTRAAMTAGYSSSQAFAKALRRATGASAGTLVRETDRLAHVLERFSVPDAKEPRQDVIVELVSLDPFNVAVKSTRGAYPALNQTYWDLFAAVPGPEGVQAILGWPMGDIDSDSVDPLIFECGLLLDAPLIDAPDGISCRMQDNARCLRIRHTGSYAGLPKALDTAYAAAIIGEHRIADRPCMFHYLDDPEETPEPELRTDLYVPLAD